MGVDPKLSTNFGHYNIIIMCCYAILRTDKASSELS